MKWMALCLATLIRLTIFWLVTLGLSGIAMAQSPETIRVMSFNLWHGGDAGGQPLAQTLAVIRTSQADVVGIQEGKGSSPEGEARPDNAEKLAQDLGWNYLAQGGSNGIISRFKILGNTPEKNGVKLELPSGNQIYVFNVHLNHSPYQPYQLLGIPYDGGVFLNTAAEAIAAARAARGEEIRRVLNEIQAVESEGLPIFLTGDFNEPSFLDWSSAVAKAKLCPIEVEWPTTKTVMDAGFVDSYREVFPDPTRHRGLTWTPITQIDDPSDRHDRIDFVFVKGNSAKVKSLKIIGESPQYADIVVKPYPSDHRAVLAEVELKQK